MMKLSNYPKLKIFFVFFFALWLPLNAFAFDQPESDLLWTDKVTGIITHPSSDWDKQSCARSGIEGLEQTFVRRGIPYKILASPKYQSLQEHRDSYYVDLEPTDLKEVILSNGGEHFLPVEENHTFMMAGGYYDACLSNSVLHLLEQMEVQGVENARVLMVTDAIFDSGTNTLEDSIDLRGLEDKIHYLKWTLTYRSLPNLETSGYMPVDGFSERINEFVRFSLLEVTSDEDGNVQSKNIGIIKEEKEVKTNVELIFGKLEDLLVYMDKTDFCSNTPCSDVSLISPFY